MQQRMYGLGLYGMLVAASGSEDATLNMKLEPQ